MAEPITIGGLVVILLTIIYLAVKNPKRAVSFLPLLVAYTYLFFILS